MFALEEPVKCVILVIILKPRDNGSRMGKSRTDNRAKGVREILLKGVFFRILFIEGVLLVFSLFFRWIFTDTSSLELFWYGIRIIILVIIIILFMMITLKKFLSHKIISPLEAIALANKKIQGSEPGGEQVVLPEDAPIEIKTIVDLRAKMLKNIFDVSEERLRLIGFIRDTFGRYISSRVVDEILESPQGQTIGGRRMTVTVLMSDLRGFTALSETRDPEEMVQLLNRYLGKMSEIILKYDGIIDEIIGDAILAVFGAPKSHGNDPERAIACAIEMQNSLAGLNKESLNPEYPPLEMGIGINTGSVIVGNIGSELRMKYGIVGSAVNRAARIESNSIGGQVLIGETTFSHAKDIIKTELPKTVMMKGMQNPLVFYSVTAIHLNSQMISLDFPGRDTTGTAIQLPFQYWIITNKKINIIPGSGTTIRLDGNTIDAFITPLLDPFTDIKLRFDFCKDAHCFEDIYAKVISIETDHKTDYKRKFNQLTITSMDQRDKDILTKWIDQIETETID